MTGSSSKSLRHCGAEQYDTEGTPQPHHQGPVTAVQSKARRRTPQGDAELMAKEQVSASSRRGDLKKSITNIASEYRIANIVCDHAMILADDATPKILARPLRASAHLLAGVFGLVAGTRNHLYRTRMEWTRPSKPTLLTDRHRCYFWPQAVSQLVDRIFFTEVDASHARRQANLGASP